MTYKDAVERLGISIPKDFRGSVFAPSSEPELAYLMGCAAKNDDSPLSASVLVSGESPSISGKRVDLVGRFFANRKLDSLVELKVRSSDLQRDFEKHRGLIEELDVIVCWVDDYVKSPSGKARFPTIVELRPLVTSASDPLVLEPAILSSEAKPIARRYSNGSQMTRGILDWARRHNKIEIRHRTGDTIALAYPQKITIMTINTKDELKISKKQIVEKFQLGYEERTDLFRQFRKLQKRSNSVTKGEEVCRWVNKVIRGSFSA